MYHKNLTTSSFLALALCLNGAFFCHAQDSEYSSLLQVDHRAVVSQADLTYLRPVEKGNEGQPIGNGRMGTMVWSTPGAIHFQINRDDVFAVNRNHTGLQMEYPDYCGACAKIELNVGGDPFKAGESFEQHLSLYDAECTLSGEKISARCFISSQTDLLVLEVDDQRSEPQPLRLILSMWRAPEVKTGDHLARLKFYDKENSILLSQNFTEGEYYCASAVGATAPNVGTGIKISETGKRVIIAPARRGKTLFLFSSAASFSRHVNVNAVSQRLIESIPNPTYDSLRDTHVRWWHEFWSRTFVHISSPDGLADFMGRVRYLLLYNMASSSRGKIPPLWNGQIHITDGDVRQWGGHCIVWTTEIRYFPLFAADAIDLTEPFFNMYLGWLPSCEIVARQRWGIEAGALFPETAPFDGPRILPEDVAQEFREVFKGKKKKSELTERARKMCLFDSHLRVVSTYDNYYSHTSHVTSSGSELAMLGWCRYRYTGDTQWLARAYPLLRSTLEFYRHFVKKDDDGHYHIYGTHVHEDFWLVKDGIMDLAAIRGTAPLAIRAARTLGVDEDLRKHWKELLENLAPYTMGSDDDSGKLGGGVLAGDVWSAGHLFKISGQHNPEDVWYFPIFPFEDWTRETLDPRTDKIVEKLMGLSRWMGRLQDGSPLHSSIRTPISIARGGRGDMLPKIFAMYYAAFRPSYSNGFAEFGGPQSHSIEHLGCISTALQEGLMQSVSARPGQSEIISVFPAWPKEWQGAFRLLARGGFLVTSAKKDDAVEFIEIESRLGETCRVRNPWGEKCLVSEIGGSTKTILDGAILEFDTHKNKRYRIVKNDGPRPSLRSIIPATIRGPTSYSLTIKNGKTFAGTLGRTR